MAMTGAVWRRENIFESRPLGVWKKTDRRQFQHTVSNFLYLNKNKITMVSGTSLELSKWCRDFQERKKKPESLWMRDSRKESLLKLYGEKRWEMLDPCYLEDHWPSVQTGPVTWSSPLAQDSSSPAERQPHPIQSSPSSLRPYILFLFRSLILVLE